MGGLDAAILKAVRGGSSGGGDVSLDSCARALASNLSVAELEYAYATAEANSMVGKVLVSAFGLSQDFESYQNLSDVFGDSDLVSAMFAKADARDSIVRSNTAFQAALASEDVMGAIATSPEVMTQIMNNITLRTLIFTSSYVRATVWAEAIGVNAILAYLAGLELSNTAGDYAIIEIPFDCSLISAASIYRRAISTGSGQDQFDAYWFPDGSTQSTIWANDVDQTTWLEYDTGATVNSEIAATGDINGYLQLRDEIDIASYDYYNLKMVSTGESPDGTERPVIEVYDPTNDGLYSHYWWGLEFTAA